MHAVCYKKLMYRVSQACEQQKLNRVMLNGDGNENGFKTNSAFSLTWPASMLIYWNKRKHLHEKRVKLPEDFLGTPTWPPFHCFGTPIWPP